MSIPDISNLIAWWKLDETSGIRYDSHGTLNLSDNNTVGYGTGKQGNAADFELSNSEYLSISLGTNLSFGDDPVTWAYWVKHESVGDSTPQRHISVRDSAGSGYTEWRMSWSEASDTFEMLVADSNRYNKVVTWSGDPSAGTWYFIVCWHDPDANTISIQVNNGTPDSTASSDGIYDGSSSVTREMHIGKLVGYTQHMDGLIDELCIWNAVLSSDERSWLYNSGAGRTYEDLFPSSGDVRWFI